MHTAIQLRFCSRTWSSRQFLGMRQVCNVQKLLGDVLWEVKEHKDIPVTGCWIPQGCETSRPRHFLDNWLTEGSKSVSLSCWLAALYRLEHSRYSFLLETESTQGHSEAGRISSVEFSDLIMYINGELEMMWEGTLGLIWRSHTIWRFVFKVGWSVHKKPDL
jgi:hypothetical protein